VLAEANGHRLLAMITDRMNNNDERALVAWHLVDLARRIDPHLGMRSTH